MWVRIIVVSPVVVVGMWYHIPGVVLRGMIVEKYIYDRENQSKLTSLVVAYVSPDS